ncbi:hypothetical protein [Halanaerobium kushneri]|uniref:Apea-like HEPN domain-containing protein n=1 Tax=Halanaerobium kushneri TaxID=56779 RepID=A0A1N6PHT3_9FIRM|nr:hypothetical protein [Halanaerobium kushneri]SIQ03843.1 hypothetical protein SAMN05421834_10195 [Halanaerobium kushneri]
MIEFGFLNESKIYSSDLMEIIPLDDITEKYEFLKENFYIENSWLYPPIGYDKKNKPTKCVSWFALPNSHKLLLKSKFKKNNELQKFIPTIFGFLKGLQMYRDGWGHYYKTPIKEGKLISFYCNDKELCKIIDKIIFLYQKDSNIFKSYAAAIHWFLFGQSYKYEFEKFDAQYKVLDCCYNIATKITDIDKAKTHAQRIENLCLYYNIYLPDWARVKNGRSTLSELRNNLIHEAKFAGEPIGVSSDEENLYFNLQLINERILLSIPGVRSEMFSTGLTRFPYSLDWIK